MTPTVLSVARDAGHRFSKPQVAEIRLVAGFGVEGDAHFGRLVQHRYDQKRNPQAPNLRQVHLIHGELLEELAGKGFAVAPGELGENVTTRGIDLLGLSRGTRLRMGRQALIEITGLRSPCKLINALAPGLMDALLDRAGDGSVIRKSGVMAVVIEDGTVRPGDAIELESVPLAHEPLAPV